MEKTWYLHYDSENKPAGFSRTPPADIASIKITEYDKDQIEKDPLRYIVLDGSLCRVPMMLHNDNSEYFKNLIAKAPKSGKWPLATDTQSILLALTGTYTGADFYIRIITERGLRTILVPSDGHKAIMLVYHTWLANNNLK